MTWPRSVAIIPAKGHSTRIPGKNAKWFVGMPIIEYSLNTAAISNMFDEIVVSTDDEYIARIARAHEATVIWRPPELCEVGVPDCGTQEVARHAIAELAAADKPFDFACCIYATAPLMDPIDLVKGYQSMLRNPAPAFVHSVGEDGKDAGQWYWGSCKAFLERASLGEDTVGLVLPAHRVCDINTEADWARAEQLYLDAMDARRLAEDVPGSEARA